jgi:hypothetical protein
LRWINSGGPIAGKHDDVAVRGPGRRERRYAAPAFFMRKERLMRHAVLGISLLVSSLLPISAHASAITVGTHYLEGSTRLSVNVPTTSTCEDAFTCHVIFNAIPSDTQLVVTEISCEVRLNGGGSLLINSAALFTFNNTNVRTDRGSFLVPTLLRDEATLNVYNLTGKVRHAFRSGERPVVRVSSSSPAAFTMQCSIAGTTGNPPE